MTLTFSETLASVPTIVSGFVGHSVTAASVLSSTATTVTLTMAGIVASTGTWMLTAAMFNATFAGGGSLQDSSGSYPI